MRGPIRIVAATLTLVLGLLSTLPVHAASIQYWVFHNWERYIASEGVKLDPEDQGTYDGYTGVGGGVGQEFTTGPNPDGYLLTYISIKIENFSDNFRGSFVAAIHAVSASGGRGDVVDYMELTTTTLRKDQAMRFAPFDGREIRLPPDTTYMFTVACTDCDSGRWITLHTTRDNIDNDSPDTFWINGGTCQDPANPGTLNCRVWPEENWTGWELEDHYVVEREEWMHDGENRQSIIITGKARWLFTPNVPKDLTATIPSRDPNQPYSYMDPSRVDLTWKSPEPREVGEWPDKVDLGACCHGTPPDPPDPPQAPTHYEYRYKRFDAQEWGTWTKIDHSAPGDPYENETTVTGLSPGVPHDIQLRAVNDDGPSAPVDTSALPGAGLGICGRSPPVRDAIVDKLLRYINNCAEVTDGMLADMVTGRLEIHASDYTYKSGDFFGLTSLTALKVSGTSLRKIPWDMFRDLTSLTNLNLSDNEICKIDAGALDHPTALEVLFLNDNHLGDISACPDSDEPSMQPFVFNKLMALKVLKLNNNRLSEFNFDYQGATYSELPSFRKLTALEEIHLRGNDLTDSRLQRSFGQGASVNNPASIFSGLPGLQLIDLWNNGLTALPDGIFSGLSNLDALYLGRNAVDPMIITVFLATEPSTVKAVVPAGAPFDIELPVSVAGGSIAGGTNALTVPAGSTESEPFAATADPGTVQDPVVSITSLPPLPGSHLGYELRDAGEQPQAPTIADLPAFSITDAAYGTEVVPGPDGAGEVAGEIEFTISLSYALTEDARVYYATSVEDGQTATSGVDFYATNGSKLFSAGTTSKTISVRLADDDLTEGPETFTVTLSNPTPNARLDENRKSGVGYILDEDARPRLVIDDASGVEGSGMVEFTISLNREFDEEVTVQYSTSVKRGQGQTATPGTDFTEVPASTATIAAGDTTTTVSIPVLDDPHEEKDETFTVTLSNPSENARLAPGPLRSAVGTIVDDDGIPPNFVSAAVDWRTLVLTYDEALDETSAPDKSAYTVHVDGGAGLAPVAVDISGSEVTLTLATAVTSGQEVTLSYAVPPANLLQDVAGNNAAGLTNEPVTNNSVDTAATGRPTISGMPEVGQVLMAGTDGIMDADGKTKAEIGDAGYAYSYRWIRVDSNGRNPTVVAFDQDTYRLVAADEGNKIKVQVSFSDDEGTAEGPLTSVATDVITGDTTAPMFDSAAVNGATLVITFDENLAEASLANSAFEVKKTPSGGNEQDVSLAGSPSISGATVTLTLGAAVVASDTDIKVSYEKPEEDNSDRLKDVTGNEVDDFDDQPVTNSSGNNAATGKPAISGIPEAGLTLTAGVGTIADDDGLPDTFPDGYSLQWVRVDADGASNPANVGSGQVSYTPVGDDVGKKIKLEVRFTDDAGNAEGPLTSDVSNVVAVPTLTASLKQSVDEGGTAEAMLKISVDEGGTAEVMLEIVVSRQPDDIVNYRVHTSDGTVNSGTHYTPVTPILEEVSVSDFMAQTDGSYKYERTYALSTTSGAESSVEGDKTFYFHIGQLSMRGHGYYSTTTGGDALITIRDHAPATGKPGIEGRPRVGEILSAATGDIKDEDGKMKAENGDEGYAYTYQWYRVDSDGSSNRTEIHGATSQIYTLTSAKMGKKVIVEASFKDDAGNAEGPLASDAYPRVGIIGVGNATGAPDISGLPRVGETLTAGTGGIVDMNGKTKADDGEAGYAYSYQWYRLDDDGVSNAVKVGLDQDSYTLTADDAGSKIRVQVSFADDLGTAEGPLDSIAYPPVGTIVAGNATGEPVINNPSGRPWVGETLTADTEGIMDEDGKMKAEDGEAGHAYSYQWYRVNADGVSNAVKVGSDQDSYELVAADAGSKIRVKVNFIDDRNNAEGPLVSGAYPELGTIRANNAAGQPVIKGPPQVGETLTANTDGIDDDDGMSNAEAGAAGYAYSYKWYRVDEDGVSNAVKVGSDQDSYELVAEDVGKKIRVKVNFKDDNGIAEGPLESDPYPQVGTVREADTTAPAFASAAVDGAALVITFDEALAAAANLANGAFTVKVNGTAVTLGSTTPPSISGATVTLTLASAVAQGDNVTVSYVKPASGSGNTLQDAAGNEVADFTDEAVTNNTADTTAPAFDSAAVDGAMLEITFDESLAAAANLANSAFTVKKTPSGGSEQTVALSGTPSISGATVTLTLASAVAQGDTVTVSYEKPATGSGNTLQDAAGNAVASFTDEAVTNNTADTTAPTFASAAVDGAALVITFDESLAAASNLVNGAFEVKVNGTAVTLTGTPVISGATVTLTLASAVAQGDTVTVSYVKPATGSGNTLQDAAGNAVASFTDQTVTNNTADTTAPTFASAAVDGTSLVITFDESLAAAPNLANGAFTVKVDGTAVTLTGTPSISGATVTLTLASAVAQGDTVTVSYVKPATGSGNKLQDAAGNETASFTDETVTNNTADTTAPSFDSAAVDGASLVITFDEALAAAANLANGAFTVKVDGTAVTLTETPSISGATVTLTLASAVAQGDTVTVSYTKPSTDNNNRLEDAAGNETADFTDEAVTNNTADTTAPAPESATVDGAALEITFDESLAAASNLANGAFEVKVNGTAVTLGSTTPPAISGATVTLTLASAVAPGDTVTVSYTKPSTDNNNRLEDAAFNETASFEDEPVTNNTDDTDDTTAPAFDSAAVDGTSLVITFDEALAAAPNLANGAFTVRKSPAGGGDGVIVSLSGAPSISGATVTVTLASAVVHDDYVTVTYFKPSTDDNNRLEDAAGNEVGFFVVVADNKTPGVTLSQTALRVHEGGTRTYTVVLETQPSGSVTVTIGGTLNTDVTVGDNTLEFTTGNWETAQTVSVTAAQDADAINDEVTLTHTASGGGYDDVSIDSVAVTVRDDDRGVTVTPTALPVTEGGSETYTVVLDGQPSGTVTVTIGGMSGTDVTVGDNTLEFTTGNWNTAQTVTVTAAQDADAVDDEVTLTHTASGGGFDDVTIDSMAVTVTDDDTADTTAPAFDSAAVDGAALVITFDESLAAAPNLANGAFEVKVGGTAVTLTGTPSISGATVTLTLASAVAPGDTVTVSYEKPASGSNNTLQDVPGNVVADFTDRPVTNNTADTTAPAFDSAAVDGTSLVIIFDEALAAAANPANSAFRVRVNGARVDLSSSTPPSISGATVTLTLASAVAQGDTVTVKYTKPGTDNNNRLEDASGNEVATFNFQTVTNNTADTTAPAPESAAVDGATLEITFDEALAAAANLANGAFEVKVAGTGVTLSGAPSISGATVTLTLASAVAHDDTVTVGYVKPAAGSNNKLQDAAGNEVADFTDRPVTNNTEDTTIPGDGCTEGSMRLRDGNTTNTYEEGRLEICAVHPDRGAVWGTICDDYWTTDEANIVCERLGYAGAESGGERFLRSYFGSGPLDILLDDLLCNGGEKSLLECPVASGGKARNRVGVHNCRKSTETVGVRCLVEAESEQHMAGLRASGPVPPSGLSVADAEAQEGAGARLDFVVTLDRAAAQVVTVDYASADGTATAGEDYVAVRGTLTFAAGVTEQTIRATVLDDSHNEGRETLMLLLVSASGADIDDSDATGTIINSDPLPKGWLARFGRTSATQVLGLLDDRFDETAAPVSQLTLGGRRIRLPAGQAGRERPDPAQTGTGRQDTEATERTENTERTERTENAERTGNTEDAASFDRLGGAGERSGAGGAEDAAGHRPDPARGRAGAWSAGGYGLPPAHPDGAAADLDGTAATGARRPNLIERAAWALLTRRGSLWNVDQRRFLSQSSFDLPLSDLYQGADAEAVQDAGHEHLQPAGRWSLWGRGALTQFAGRDAAVQIDGDVLTGVLGLDYRTARRLTGVALSWSDGGGRYRSDVDSEPPGRGVPVRALCA